MQRLYPLLLLSVLFCKGSDYPELRRLFLDGEKLFQESISGLEKADSPVAAVMVMRQFNTKGEELIAQKNKIEEKYPELQSISTLRQTCDRMQEFHNFRRAFADFHRRGKVIAREFEKAKDFKAELLRGRQLILRML